MQAAKDAINKITHKGGREDTTVHERVAPAVTQETVTRQQEDRVQTAVDKEVHQDHYHTSVQPVKDQEVLPEQHHHRMGEVEHRTFDHNDDSKTQQRLQQEAAQFRDTQTRVEGGQTTSVEPTVAGEHVHHHVHETIQPVVNKQTIEPHVVHTTVPVHETHHNAAQHHATSALPAVSMDEFKNKGGALEGRGERSDQFQGAPKTVGESGLNGSSGLNSNSNSNTVGSNGNASQWGNETRNGLNGASGTSAGVSSGTSSTGKPSLMDKLNPKKDADQDGKTGIMD